MSLQCYQECAEVEGVGGKTPPTFAETIGNSMACR